MLRIARSRSFEAFFAAGRRQGFRYFLVRYGPQKFVSVRTELPSRSYHSTRYMGFQSSYALYNGYVSIAICTNDAYVSFAPNSPFHCRMSVALSTALVTDRGGIQYLSLIHIET